MELRVTVITIGAGGIILVVIILNNIGILIAGIITVVVDG